jgi:glycosyltransferase involved in cell wall biosynthesis
LPTICAIVPLYNGKNYLAEALRSVLNQTRQPDEIFVVDDGSTDDGLGVAIVEDFCSLDSRIKLLRKPNGGQGSARNFGVRHSNSDFIALLDQDDIWYPHHLAELEKPYRKPSAYPLGWVYSNVDRINANGGMVCHNFLDTLGTHEHPKRRLMGCLMEDMMVLPGAALIERKAFDSVGGFDESLSGYEDDDLFLRMYCAGYRSVYINRALTKWRIHAKSTSFTDRMARSRMQYFEKLVVAFPDERELQRFYIRDLVAPRFLRNAMNDLCHGIDTKDKSRARLAYKHILRLTDFDRTKRRVLYRTVAWLLTNSIALRIIPHLPNAALHFGRNYLRKHQLV